MGDSDGSGMYAGHPESGDLSPLSQSLHDGLMAISVFAFLSFVMSTTLFVYLTVKMIAWRLARASRADMVAKNMPEPPIGVEFTAQDRAFGPQGQDSKAAHQQNVQQLTESRARQPNQFLVLVTNLLLADMHQATAFLLSHTWLRRGGIFVDTPTCFVQGFFDSNGDLASSCFITAIAVHTYLSVVKGWRPSPRSLYIGIALIWLFVYSLSVIPILATHDGNDAGGYYVRAGAWCWINDAHETLRLATHYIFIFLALLTTSTLYVLIFFTLRRQARSQAAQAAQDGSTIRLGHNPAFLIYPIIYILCTLPLAVGRIASMAGSKVPMEYYCFAGAAIASNGWCDVLLFGTTRHVIIFGSKDDVNASDTGLDTFAFMRTPAGKRFGNTIWIQGGKDRLQEGYGVGGWWRRIGSGVKTPHRRESQESLRSAGRNDLAIQMDVVTSMTVEVDGVKGHGVRYPDPLAVKNPSLSSGDRDFTKDY